VAVTLARLGEYVVRVAEVTLRDGVAAQMRAVCAGFTAVVSTQQLRIFSADEVRAPNFSPPLTPI
jgi:hypothetical protein